MEIPDAFQHCIEKKLFYWNANDQQPREISANKKRRVKLAFLFFDKAVLNRP